MYTQQYSLNSRRLCAAHDLIVRMWITGGQQKITHPDVESIKNIQ